MIELAIGIGVVAVATAVAVRSRARGIGASAPANPGSELEDERLGVGDVLLHYDAELWLAGCVSLHEAGPLLRLFPTPGGGQTEYVMELAHPRQRWVALRRSVEIEAGPLPDPLRIGGFPLTLERKGLARVYAVGEHLPKVSDRADYTLHHGIGDRFALVLDFVGGERLALTGEALDAAAIDRLPGRGVVDPPAD